MKIKSLGILIVLAFLLTGFNTVANAAVSNTPDILGGSELRTRRGDHSAYVPNLVFRHGAHNKKLVALSFDDGPDVHYTTKILNILKQNNIKATFFIIGKRAKAHPKMVKLISDEGHVIGNHTWDHPDIKKIDINKLKNEVQRTGNLIHSIVGYKPHLFRPPYGDANANDIKELGKLGYKIIDWTVDTRDWAGTSPDKILNNVKKEVRPGAIVLEHCAGGKGEKLDNTVAALPKIIAYLKHKDYRFVTVPQLLHISK
jgi:polysaccharide deacetylase family sporulation protein PdaB